MKNLKKVIIGIIIIFTLCVILYLNFVANEIKQYAVFDKIEGSYLTKATPFILILKNLVSSIFGILPL